MINKNKIMEEFLVQYIEKDYHPNIVARFIHAFKTRLPIMFDITGIKTSQLKNLISLDSLGYECWKRDEIKKYEDLGKIFWNKIKGCDIDLLLQEPEESVDEMWNDSSEEFPTFEYIINSLGTWKGKGVIITDFAYDDYKSDNFVSVSDLIKDLKKMRGTIRILDLCNNLIKDDLDRVVTELQNHHTLTELKLRSNHLTDGDIEELLRLKDLPLVRIDLRKNYGPSSETILQLEKFVKNVQY